MLEKLEAIRQRYDDVNEQLMQPEAMSDMKRYKSLNKEYKDLGRIVAEYRRYQEVLSNIEGARAVISTEKDEDFREMAKAELDELLPEQERLETVIKDLLLPKDPNDSKDVIMEIRAGAGGDEAAIFAGDLQRMYMRYAEKQNLRMDLIDATEGTSGGYKEIILSVKGEDVYGKLKFESGVHRVQRVPATETQGRIHTSVASIVVMPEAEELDVEIDMNDVRKDLFMSSGPGGQSVNTTYSAVRLTHLPTGLVAQCQDQKSQLKNFDKALQVLRSRIYEIELAKKNEAEGAQRKSMIGGGDRSDKIRTYNYPQGRVTDHRIGYTVYNLASVMEGNIDDFVEQLRIAESAERLKEGVS
ncbi:peptide chain release factor 1 [Hymenobacter qilianensis]|uniref:Peptide chain release factor 1 n=2 Tax=Hymenobacter qilianensis TaxID=1385715 RepID=A0A7H0GYA6_9BACT|nr:MULTISPECIES: peptide chain release factor 1 [Hymenobacter]MBC6608146.1 peptide chain release factor 1 [Hymenobacter sp. BT188]QIL76581.1 peptide chain release factor 1 [Hymenobacter sp. HDW8]QNP53272.1 peptide chain release factor 1 [Hymenobacter qilianensis]GGF58150.1 peptide chain release factor 1 [Hymenobacter qilianensis]